MSSRQQILRDRKNLGEPVDPVPLEDAVLVNRADHMRTEVRSYLAGLHEVDEGGFPPESEAFTDDEHQLETTYQLEGHLQDAAAEAAFLSAAGDGTPDSPADPVVPAPPEPSPAERPSDVPVPAAAGDSESVR